MPDPHATPTLQLDGFDGPLDLLLDLAQRQRIDLGRLSIAALAEQFAAQLTQRLQHAALDRRADWIVLACHLLLLRSRLLGSPGPADAAGAARPAGAAGAAGEGGAEIDRIEAMLRLRAAAAWLDAQPQLGRDVFARPRRGRDPRTASYMALMQACLTLLRDPAGPAPPAPAPRPVPMPVLRVADAIARIRARLAAHPDGGALASFLPAWRADAPHRARRCRQALASTLIAGLELARNGRVHLQQDTAFGPIVVHGAGIGAADQARPGAPPQARP